MTEIPHAMIGGCTFRIEVVELLLHTDGLSTKQSKRRHLIFLICINVLLFFWFDGTTQSICIAPIISRVYTRYKKPGISIPGMLRAVPCIITATINCHTPLNVETQPKK
jgi:hypothetical protein